MYERLSAPMGYINKSRYQCALWASTHEVITRLSKRLDMSKSEVMHLALVEMEKFYTSRDEE